MLKANECCVNDCNSEITTFEEVATGVCAGHRNLFTRSKHFVGVCWNCSSITGVYKIQRRLLGILTERYLFSKGCSKCSKTPNAETSWITLTKYEPATGWAIREDGQLVGNVPRVKKIKEEHNGAN